MEVRNNTFITGKARHAMGEVQGTLFQPEFNRSIHVEARPERLSADTGALLLRELAQRLGLPALLEEHLSDPRDPSRTVHPFVELILTQLLLDAQGWTDQTDVSLLRNDPILRLAVSRRRGDGPVQAGSKTRPDELCSQPTLSRLLDALAEWENRVGLEAVLLGWAERRAGLGTRHLDEVTLDLDSVPVVVHEHQPGSAYNGHLRARCYHPVVVRWDRGDYLGAELRPGNAALLEHYRQRGTAERDFGEWKNALDLSLSSTPRPKAHYREQPISVPYEEPDSFAANVLDAAAELLGRHMRQACSRERFRQLVLRVAGRVLLSGREITVVVSSAVAPLWSAVWTEMELRYPARGSPELQALPIPA